MQVGNEGLEAETSRCESNLKFILKLCPFTLIDISCIIEKGEDV